MLYGCKSPCPETVIVREEHHLPNSIVPLQEVVTLDERLQYIKCPLCGKPVKNQFYGSEAFDSDHRYYCIDCEITINITTHENESEDILNVSGF